MRAIAVFLLVFGISATAGAASVHVAVAANFAVVLKEIATAFEQESGHEALISVGSTGKLYTQIANGAPFDVFLAADQKRPQLAEQNGLALAGSRMTYAYGKLALYPASSENTLRGESLSRLAIANPKTAPYGEAALQILKGLGLYEQLTDKLVYGENIAQTYQFVATGNVSAGFVALSQVMGKTDKWVVPQAYYTPLAQDGVLIKDNDAARAFMDFLKSDKARRLMAKYGYE